VWPAYAGSILEGGEALLYTFAVAHSASGWIWIVLAAVAGFTLPWLALRWLRGITDRMPKWQVELSIGIVLMGAATNLGVLRFIGILS